MERHRAIRVALACALAIIGLLVLVATAPCRDADALVPRIAAARAGAVIAKRAIRVGSSLHVDKRDQGVSRDRAGDGLPLHASLPPCVADAWVRLGSERARAPSCSSVALHDAPLRRWGEARAPPLSSTA